MLNKKLRFIVDLLKQSIKNSVFENHVYIIGGCLRDNFNRIETFNDVDIIIDLPNDSYIDFSKYMCNKYNIRSLYNPFIEKSKHTSAFSLFNIKEISDVMFDIKMCIKNKEYECGTIEENFNIMMDFSINSLCYDVSNDKLIIFNEKSLDDIKNGIIRQNHNDIFNISPIRILRAIRFVSYGYTIEEETLNNMKCNLHLLNELTKEHIEYEMKKYNGFANNLKSIEIMDMLNIDYVRFNIIKKG